MSAVLLKADIPQREWHVRYVPKQTKRTIKNYGPAGINRL
jgi:hypothetical protein